MTAKELYRRERKNLQNRIRSWQKRGYELLFDIPAIPKRITKSSAKALQKLQLKDLVKKGKVVSREYGDVLTPYRYEEEQATKRRDRRLLKDAQRKKAKQDYQDYLRAQAERERERAEELELAEYYEALERREPWALTKYYAEHGRQYGEDEYDSSDFYAETGYTQGGTIDIEEQAIPELDELQAQILEAGLNDLYNVFVQKRKEKGDVQFYKDYSIGDSASKLQEAVGLAIEYKAKGNYYKAGELAIDAISILQGAPVEAVVFENVSKDVNYAP